MMNRFMGGGFARVLTVALGSYALIGAASAAQAQNTPNVSAPSNPQPTQEVVVTATRRDMAAEKVGVSLTVIGAQELKALAPSKLDDLQGIAPNVFIGEEVGAPNQSLIFIRSQGYADVEMDQAPPVGVIQDGVTFGTSTGQLASMFDVCSVEVDRGPQGIFYGKNTTAGLININRCAPTRRYGAEISGGYGSYNDGFLRGVFNAPLGDKGGFKLAAQYHTNDGYVKDVFDGKHVGGDHMFAINARVNYDLTNWLNADLSYDHVSESGGGNPVQYGDVVTAGALAAQNGSTPAAFYPNYNPVTGSPIGLKPREVDTRPGAVNDTYQNDVLSLILKAHTPIGDLVSQTAYLDQSDSDDQDYDGTCVYAPGCSGPGAGGNYELQAVPALPGLVPLELEADRVQTFKQFTQEERLSGSISQFDYLIGAFYYHDVFTLHQHTDLFFLYEDQQSAQNDDSWSEFGNLDWNPTSTIKLSAGIRNISETKDARTAFQTDSASTVPNLAFSHTWNHVITRFNAQWQITPDSLLYANRSEGFRSGGYSIRGTVSESQPGQPNYSPGANFLAFQPETNVTYEIGAKNRWFGNALVFNIDGFINDIRDFQQASTIETPGYGPNTNDYIFNIPKVEIKGIELELTARVGHWVPPLEGLTLSANAGFQKGRITDGKVNGQEAPIGAGGTGGPVGSVADFTGTPLQRSPSDNFTVRGTYVHALGPDDGRLTVTTGYAWTAKYLLSDLSPTQPDYQPSYGLLDASVTYNWKNYYAKLSGRNLTNTDYRQFSLPSVFIQSWAPPATVEIEVGAKF